jgi:Prophage CP4-57 regulatory protein (AlpA)
MAIDDVARLCLNLEAWYRPQRSPKPRFPEKDTEMLNHSERLLRLRDVKEKTGLGSSTIYRPTGLFRSHAAWGRIRSAGCSPKLMPGSDLCRRLEAERRPTTQADEVLDRHLISHD